MPKLSQLEIHTLQIKGQDAENWSAVMVAGRPIAIFHDEKHAEEYAKSNGGIAEWWPMIVGKYRPKPTIIRRRNEKER